MCIVSTGKILVKGKEFKCPECNGSFEIKEVIEKVLKKIKLKLEVLYL